MKTPVLTAVAVLLAPMVVTAAHAQTAPQSPPASAAGSDFTRDLNSGPPAPATYLAPAPAPTPAAPAPDLRNAAPLPGRESPSPSDVLPRRAEPIPTTPAPPPRTEPLTPDNAPPGRLVPATPSPRSSAPTSAPAPATTPPPSSRPPAPLTSAPVAAAPATTAPAPAAVTPPPPPPNVPTVTVLDAPARAALPFTAELPQGFDIVTGRPGPNFRIYTIRRRADERSFVMVYVGPSSQFPIYSGETVQAGGRASVVATQDGQRHAVEHLFQRETDPREIHIWTMTLDGADQAMAERIAQSVDLR